MLVANRGEIARRVIRTLRRLGIRSVAVYSDADVTAPHVAEADEAVRIGPAAAAESYLSIEAVIDAAKATGAQAIHPGYGFLSENAAFGHACAEAGIVFIGPDERALDVMGDKIRAKAHVAAHGVPTVPGFSAAGMSDEEIADAADAAGYPLLIKPSAGGGGKGMQIVRSAAELDDALATARRVARSSFGDDTLLLERLIERPRHIEVQVLGDAAGTVIHLGERECTLQRRHQKVIEESPSPVIDEETRARIGAAACAAAASIGYQGAGTVEFLVAGSDTGEFFFIEMNTRLQVEHPVTELVTGIDLVEQQLRIAAGLPLEIAQEDVHLQGHAIEARVYAESPARGFLPATGEVLRWTPSPDARSDAAVETGSVVTADYDPMIAKVIAHGSSREEALSRLDTALADTVLLGVESNIAFLRALLADPGVQAGDMDTGLIDRMPPFQDPAPSPAALRGAASALPPIVNRTRPHASPLWCSGDGWRMGEVSVPCTVWFETGDGALVSTDLPLLRSHSLRAPGRNTRSDRDRNEEGAASVEVRAGSRLDAARIIGWTTPAGTAVAWALDGTIWVHTDGVASALLPLSRREAAAHRLANRERAEGAAGPDLRAPMPGAVTVVHVADGDAVTAGQRIVTIEAMKMEHPLLAPHDGIVTLHATVGDQVSRDQLLAVVTSES
ncbi:ATP-grasp domain-containing protein [Microbacterium sp. KUDC0406]|uniref:acetyl/propionyl/methylcrotonyl-CoA carboxylase subunit alpha n=1 Tax=Microbacterium sp. KUDC0406 TaxID=2909588 RepID=UPI001F24332E|nr:biotin carboxylase N-terminal domain-containing protein [Microbacterium sp. KUDC0406]UJP10003.1 ATP-grasp domain-containing protein [Microbacterium sp. KUDC0406]